MRIVPMRLIFLGGRAIASILLAALVVACDKHSNTVSGPSGTTPTFTVEINGPDSLAPGQSVQYSVIVHSSDGIDRVPASIHWTASPPSVLQVTELGLATGGQVYGDAAVNAEVTLAGGFRVVSKNVFVLPDGTYRVVGTVSDTTSAVVANALVAVTSGPLSTTTDHNGHYSLSGVPPDAEFRITGYGYDPWVERLAVNANTTRNFQLTPSGAISSLAGRYTLSIDVIDECREIRADLLHRRYDAVLTQNRLIIDVALTESRFLSGSSRFHGRADTGGVTFGLDSVDFFRGNFPSIAERLPDGTFMVVDGTAVTTASGSSLSGTLD